MMRRNAIATTVRGATLVEMLATIALLTVVLNISTQIFSRLLRTPQEIAEADRASIAVDRSLQLFRRDVEGANFVTVTPDSIAIDDVRWTIEADALVRTQNDRLGHDRVERFSPFRERPSVEQHGAIVTLRIGRFADTVAPLTAKGAP